jgi:hypothetical protein
VAKAEFSEPFAKTLMSFGAPKLLVDTTMIHHVVAVRASGSCLEIGRSVYVGDAEITQISGDRSGIVERELLV